ncbi:MAG: hypothetical protein AAF602_11105 [Myxococcota bacterium]
MEPWLILAPSDSAAGNLKASGVPPRTVSCVGIADLVYRPLAPLDDLGTFVEVMDRGQAALFEQDPGIFEGWDEIRASEGSRLEALAEQMRTIRGLRVAVGESAAERLVLAFAEALLQRVRPDADGVPLQRLDAALVEPEGLGGTPPSPRFATDDAWVAVSPEERALLETLWSAAVSDEPTARNQLVGGDDANAAIARRLAHQHPHRRSGLSTWDRALLARLAVRPRSVSDMFGVQTLWGADLGHPNLLLRRLRHLARGPEPLIVSTGAAIGFVPPHPDLSLTTRGRAVLAGQATALTLRHEHRVGGIEVAMADGLWVRDDDDAVVRWTEEGA